MTTPWPRMLKRDKAAAYCDLSVAAFEREIVAGRLPAGVMLGGRAKSPLDDIDDNPHILRMDWTDFLTSSERRTLQAIKERHAFDMKVKRRIYDRCRKHMDRKTKREQETNLEKQG